MDNIEQQIKEHALRDTPREACGLLVNTGLEMLSVVPCVNISPEPEKSFIINPSDYLPYLEAGTLAEYYHSHPNDAAVFSPADISISEHSHYPIRVYSVVDDAFNRYVPEGAIVPLLGRQFVFGVLDCVSLVDDYYSQKLGITFEPLARNLSDVTEGIPDIFNWIKKRDLVIVSKLQKHDIVLMNFGRVNKPNHAGIFLGDGLMMHQLVNKPSEITVYGGYWQKVTMFCLRHKGM